MHGQRQWQLRECVCVWLCVCVVVCVVVCDIVLIAACDTLINCFTSM